jgi:hypothetical protein
MIGRQAGNIRMVESSETSPEMIPYKKKTIPTLVYMQIVLAKPWALKHLDHKGN